MFIHPHLSTVTYLTNIGAPTMILPCLADCSSGAPEFRQMEGEAGYVSCPKIGKHLSFDGRLLHAAPSELVKPEVLVKLGQQNMEWVGHRRVTFLVNIWLNHRSIGVQPFPEALVGKLSGNKCWNSDAFSRTEQCGLKNIAIRKEETTEIRWLLGASCDAEEHIQVQVPLNDIQRELSNGGTLCLQWKQGTLEGIRHIIIYKTVGGPR